MGALFLLCSHASATTIVTIEEVGSDVVATVSGTVDLTGLTYSTTSNGGASLLEPNYGTIVLHGGNFDGYSGITGPGSFGSGDTTPASSKSGDDFGLLGYADIIQIPHAYISGTNFSSTATWDGTTLAALGITPGTYTWNWGSGADADSLTLYAGVNPPATAPEPGSLLLLSTGFAAFAGFALRKRGNQ
jgi:hypothetical protein